MNKQTVFKPKQEKTAECIAYLTNSVISNDEKRNLVLVSESEINEKIGQRLEKKDFIGAAELLESAKKLLKEPVHEVAEVVSKSIRLPFPTHLKLIEVAQKKNMSLADTIRITSILTMKNKLNEFRDDPAVDQEKLRVMYNLLEEWRAKKSTSAYKEYSPEFLYRLGNEISDLFDKFTEFSIYDICRECDIPIEPMREYLKHNYHINWDAFEESSSVTLEFDPQLNLFKLTIDLYLEQFFYNYIKFKESIDPNLHKKLDDVVDITEPKSGYYDSESDYYLCPSWYGTYVSGTLRIENNKLFFDGVDIKQRDTLNALIYEKITNEKYTDFAVEECIKQVHEALARNDYDTAAQLNEELAMFQVTSKIASWYGDIIASIAEESNVVTFTIPKLLLLLWEATKEDRSIQEFVEENLQEA